MRDVFRPGIRRNLFLLAAILTVPLAAISFTRARERLHGERELLAERARGTARQSARLIDSDINTARTILASIATLIRVSDSPEQNHQLLQRVFSEAEYNLTNVVVADSQGKVRASLLDLTPRGYDRVSSEPFMIAMREKRSYVGHARRSLVLADSGWVIPFTMPILQPQTGRLIGVAGASLAVDSMAAIKLVRSLPKGSLLSVLTRDGVIFLRSSDMQRFVGKTTPDTAFLRYDMAHPDSVREIVALDGSRFLAGHANLDAIDAMVLLGIPMAASGDAAERQFTIDLILAALGTVLFILFAVVAARRIARPLHDLTEVANALTAGNRTRRAVDSGPDEVGDLARSLNQLADTVDERERALQASEARYRRLFATSPLPTLTWSMNDGRIDQYNDAAKLFFGEARLRGGTRILDLVAEDRREAFAALPLPDASVTMHAGLWPVVSGSGHAREVEIFVGTLEQVSGTVAVGVLIDVTEQKKAELELEKSREHLRQVQKLEALGAFAGGIAHDFNNYLSAISTNAEMVESALPANSDLRIEVSEILGAAQRASALTRQILVFSRRQVVHDERIDVNAAIQGMQRLLTRLAGEQIEIRIDCGEKVPDIMLDHGRLEQVLMNLAANSRDAMPGGGVLTIATRRTATGDLELVVEDTGEGIPQEILSRVFEPFYTTKPRDRGTGLGLAMVYSIVSAAGGETSIESEVGKGTKITMKVPGLSGNNTPSSNTAVRAGDAPRGSEHILVVEDDAAVRLATSSLLSRSGYKVSTAEDAAAARELLEKMKAPPDLILSDVVMPHVSGPKLAAEIAARYPGVRVLFMSGYADDDVVMQGIAAQSLHLIAKPFTAKQLLTAIRERLDSAAG